ncbi:MAG: hypothetical protein U1E82_01680 [Nitrosomonas sp.]
MHDRVRLPRHPARKGFELTQPTAQTLSDELTWLSILPIIDTGLLRRLRTEMQWGGSELESLIWNHACFSQTSLGLRMPDSRSTAIPCQVSTAICPDTPGSALLADRARSPCARL